MDITGTDLPFLFWRGLWKCLKFWSGKASKFSKLNGPFYGSLAWKIKSVAKSTEGLADHGGLACKASKEREDLIRAVHDLHLNTEFVVRAEESARPVTLK